MSVHSVQSAALLEKLGASRVVPAREISLEEIAAIRQNIERTAILASGAGVAVFYGNASPVPTGDADLKRIQINLTIKEYKNGR